MRVQILALLASLAVVGASCSGDGATGGKPSSPVTGVILTIDSEGFDEVQGFTLRADGETYDFVLAPGQDFGFPLAHLQSHLVGAEPVEVSFEERDGELFATAIDDA
jgi:hypothetical protein